MSDPGAYREWRVAGELHPYLACAWTVVLPASGGPDDRRIIPDACIDIIWTDGRLFVAGPDTVAVTATMRPGSTVSGVRFRPGLAPTLLGLPAAELLDRRVELAALWGERDASSIANRLSAAITPEEGAALLEDALLSRLRSARPRDLLVEALVRSLRAPAPRDVAAVAESLGGIGPRQLRRRTIAAVGYGPRMLGRVLRLQRAVALGPSPWLSLAGIAAGSGYADQAHMTREFRELAGTSPATLLGRRAAGVPG